MKVCGMPKKGRSVLIISLSACLLLLLDQAFYNRWANDILYSYALDASLLFNQSSSLLTPDTTIASNQSLPTPDPPSSYVCSATQNQGSTDFFAHTDCPSAKQFSIPNRGFIFEKRYFKTIYETRVRDVFAQVLPTKTPHELQQGVVLDIGGNSGWYTAYAAVCFGTVVHVFEPQEGCLDILCPLVAHNHIQDLVTIHHRIVADESKTISITQDCDPGFSPDHHLLPDINANAPEKETPAANGGNTARVTSIRAIDVVKPNQPVLMIKIDTEGTEMGVLASMEALLQDGRATDVVVEVKFQNWQEDNRVEENMREFMRLVYDNGFRVYSLERSTYVEKDKFTEWLTTVGAKSDNNFWLQKRVA